MTLSLTEKPQIETLTELNHVASNYQKLLLARPSFSLLHKILLDSINLELILTELTGDEQSHPLAVEISQRLLAISNGYLDQVRSRRAELLHLIHSEHAKVMGKSCPSTNPTTPPQGDTLIAVVDSSLSYDTVLPQLTLDAWSLHRDDARAASLLLAPSSVANALKEVFLRFDPQLGINPELAITTVKYRSEDPAVLETAFALWSPLNPDSPYRDFLCSYQAAKRLLQTP
jgi:hypothetical protein